MTNFHTEAKEVVTRKNHKCSCYELFNESGYKVTDLPTKYQDIVIKVKSLKGEIPKGTKCYKWSGVHDGEWYTAYSFIEMHELVCEMDWWD